MIIFQTASSDLTGLSLDASLLKSDFVPATTFRNNAYIHRLNRTLQAEMRALSAYRSLTDRDASVGVPAERLIAHVEGHQAAGKELVRLIIANRGVPEDRSALSFGLTRTLIHICSRVPVRLFERATLGTLATLEKQLVVSYRKLINEAPLRDVPVLEDLLTQTERRVHDSWQ
jgi:hypothetical protein